MSRRSRATLYGRTDPHYRWECDCEEWGNQASLSGAKTGARQHVAAHIALGHNAEVSIWRTVGLVFPARTDGLIDVLTEEPA